MDAGDDVIGSELDDGERLWRRVPPDRLNRDQPHPAPQGNAFRARGDETYISVDRAVVHEAADRDPSAMLLDVAVPEEWGVLETTVADVRRLTGSDVFMAARPENDAHAAIHPPISTAKKSSRLSKDESTRWILEPKVWPPTAGLNEPWVRP